MSRMRRKSVARFATHLLKAHIEWIALVLLINRIERRLTGIGGLYSRPQLIASLLNKLLINVQTQNLSRLKMFTDIECHMTGMTS